MPLELTSDELITLAAEVLDIEARAVNALREEVERLADLCEDTRAQLAETHERLDFAERLLTAGRAPKDKTGG